MYQLVSHSPPRNQCLLFLYYVSHGVLRVWSGLLHWGATTSEEVRQSEQFKVVS